MVGSLYMRLSRPDESYEIITVVHPKSVVGMRVLGFDTFWDIVLNGDLSPSYQLITNIFT